MTIEHWRKHCALHRPVSQSGSCSLITWDPPATCDTVPVGYSAKKWSEHLWGRVKHQVLFYRISALVSNQNTWLELMVFACICRFPVDIILAEFAIQHITWHIAVVWKPLGSIIWGKLLFFIIVYMSDPTRNVLPRQTSSSFPRIQNSSQLIVNSVIFHF